MKPKTMRLGIIGCGAIGRQLARALAAGRVPGIRVTHVHDRLPERARRLASGFKPQPAVATLAQTARGCDLLFESAGQEAVPAIAAAARRARRDLMVMSVGALIRYPGLQRSFERAGLSLYYPSGAVAGLDGVRAAAAGGGLRRVVLTTRKPPAGLAGAPYCQRRYPRLRALRRPARLFDGSAREAIRHFPQNVNVAAAVALAGLGPRRTRVSVIADPGARRNTHTLEAEGAFGRMTVRIENRPSPDNPKTSLLAAASALALLARIAAERLPRRRRA